MSLSQLPLSYCTNVHPGMSLAEVVSGLKQYTVPVGQVFGQPLAAGLWLAAPVIAELRAAPEKSREFAGTLQELGLPCYTLNAFPFGNFHDRRVKENVYLPDWSQPARARYTVDCARVLADLLPAGCEGSISTVPLGFKQFSHPDHFLDLCIQRLLETAQQFNQLHRETGRLIRLAIEPEPLCLLETTPETVAFFERLFARADQQHVLPIARRHLGICYDVCHQAVEFEAIPQSIETIDRAGIRLNKIHITCALQLEHPATNLAAREALARYVEERYLHQTVARIRDGQVLRQVDLTPSLALDPPPSFRDADCWRIHFHVPVDAERLGPLGTTREELKQALAAVSQLDYAPHLEVETYTWEVLPDRGNARNPADLIQGLARELTATRHLLASTG